MSYDWGTQWAGVLSRHADDCPFADGETCTCGPLGYTAAIADPETGARVVSPLLDGIEEARAWRREQEAVAGAVRHANGNGNGHGPARRPPQTTSRRVAAVAAREARRASGPPDALAEPGFEEPAPRRVGPAREPRRPAPAPPEPDVSISELIDEFLDAAEDGEARGADGRPYTDDDLAELSWALTGYVESHLTDVDAGQIRGRHVFRLVDELEDAGMPRSRLRSVLGALSELFDYAVDRGLVRVNPARYISLPDDERPLRRAPVTLESRNAAGPVSAGPFDNAISEQTIWFIVKIVALVFICIALVLVAESV